jgi:lipopolysaccharide export system protein LptA
VNKYVLSLLFLLSAAMVFGQSKSRVNLVSSTTTEAAPGPNGTRIIKVHNGVFKQDYSTLTSDSAYFYADQNMVDAFGHVVINQGDTVHIYADKLNYNGNTKTALLTNHVIMVDKDATLTTDYFTYNTATRIGTYTDGGKLVNKDNTVVSKNGYYFAFTRDAYFRYDVVCNTPDAVIKTDTMRYNSGTRITYFYGPTIITGKDKDNLYTENGTYNTATQQAFFGKKNLYTQKTKSLRGDSLFYDRKKGYGRAVKHVTFNDSQDKVTIKGDLGEFYKSNEQAVITQNPYMIFVTEDSSKVKAADKKLPADSLAKNKAKGADSLLKNAQIGNIDELAKNVEAAAKMLPADKKLTMQAVKDSVTKNLPSIKNAAAANSSAINKAVAAVKKATGTTPPTAIQFPKKIIPKFESVYKFADTVQVRDKPKPGIRYDSLYFVADTLKTQSLTFKDFKILKQKQYDAAHPDTTIKAVKKPASVFYKTPPKTIPFEPIAWPRDTSYIHLEYFGKPKAPAPKPVAKVVVKAPAVVKPVVKLSPQDSLKAQQKADSIALRMPKPLSDTSRIRIVSGYHNAKLFKSDLQAKADSMFYSSSDSTIRMFTNPMIWTQSSQLSGDTVNLQMKNKKLDNLDMYPAAFIVNLEKNDSTFYNQAGGKRMHGTFKNGKLNTFAIIGNAETIYFKRDTIKNVVTDMSRTVSGRAYFGFENGEIVNNSFVEKYEAKGIPIGKVTEDNKILKGFIWKPKERPVSKEAILNRKKPVVKPAAKPAATTQKPPGKLVAKPADAKLGKDTITKAPPALNTGKDSLLNMPVIKSVKDSLIKKDTTQQRRSVILKP